MSAASTGTDSSEPSDSPRAVDPMSTSDLSAMTEWTLEITPRHRWLEIPIREIWDYRDLLFLLVQRDLVAQYKQTILGPIWFVLQPLLITVMFVLVFGNIANIPTEGVPPVLFYLSGVVAWSYFSETFLRTSGTFIANAEIFAKVYFPRLVVPLSQFLNGGVKFLVQLSIFLLIYAGMWVAGADVHPNLMLLLLPVFVGLMALIGMGWGILFSALTTKYRDLNLVVQFGVQLLMYATPIIYPMSLLSPKIRNVMWWNPLSHLVEAIRYGFFGSGTVTLAGLAYSTLFTILVVVIGVIVFHKTEQNVVDTV
jgi:ABC-type polysaccharide/polyol phosphate export systems, permease component